MAKTGQTLKRQLNDSPEAHTTDNGLCVCRADALRLARHYTAGLIQGIHVPDEYIQKHRNLIRFRKKSCLQILTGLRTGTSIKYHPLYVDN